MVGKVAKSCFLIMENQFKREEHNAKSSKCSLEKNAKKPVNKYWFLEGR
jgi:hypothetical protein